MTRPLLITDCDEVLLHMVTHFGAWLGEAHDIDFALVDGNFAGAMRRRACGSVLPREEAWPLLGGFFDTEMHRQTLVPHAREALAALAPDVDIVILTNLEDHRRAQRLAQLAAFGIDHRVETNQGPKGAAIARLIAEYRPSAAVFVDDLPQHLASAAETAPDVWRLHMVSEPTLAARIPPAPAAHARIDDWREAKAWIADKLGLTAAAQVSTSTA